MAAERASAGHSVPACSLCSRPAVLIQRERNRYLCAPHLIADIEERVGLTITRENLIASGDCIAVGLSGGKDSTALLLLLHTLLESRTDVRIVAVTVDEGIAGYREETVRSAECLVRDLGIEHYVFSFTELFGDTLDGILRGRESRACSICGILRKKALITGAEQVGASRLATGHNLDDEAQSVLMNVLRGDLVRLARNSSAASGGRFIPRIKPLMYIHEKEIAAYLLVRGAWADLPECPYACHALRREVREMLGGLEYEFPGTMLRLLESRKAVTGICSTRSAGEPFRHCAVCGDPCSGEICQLCRLRQSLNR